MPLQDSVVQRIDLEIGTSGQPYRILANGTWHDTGCTAWSLPSQSEGANTVLSDYRSLATRLWGLMEDSGVLARLQTSGLPLWPPSDELSREFADILEHIEEGPEIEALIGRLNALVEPYQQTTVHGIRIVEVSTLTPNDPTYGVNELLWQVRELVKDCPVTAYRAGLEWMDFDVAVASLLVVAPTTDQFDILRIEQTDGANYALSTEDIIARLGQLDAEFGIDIVGAGFSVVEFLLRRVPRGEEARKLGRWLFDLCPDLLEPPTTFDKGRVALWWD